MKKSIPLLLLAAALFAPLPATLAQASRASATGTTTAGLGTAAPRPRKLQLEVRLPRGWGEVRVNGVAAVVSGDSHLLELPAGTTRIVVECTPRPPLTSPLHPLPREHERPVPPSSQLPLTVVEAQRISIERAFGGRVEFARTRAFDDLARWLLRRARRRELHVQVRSRIDRTGPHPTVLAVGLWARVHDRSSNTISPPIKVRFEGGPYARRVQLHKRGRVVGSFEFMTTRHGRAAVAKALCEIRRRIRRLVMQKG